MSRTGGGGCFRTSCSASDTAGLWPDAAATLVAVVLRADLESHSVLSGAGLPVGVATALSTRR